MEKNNSNNQKQLLIYQAEDGSFQIKVRLESETIWLNQKQMSELFGTSTDNIYPIKMKIGYTIAILKFAPNPKIVQSKTK
ncbi:hypothetical protein [Candidatus Paracaedibacter symbiosus]|uniref:hypothetical protein n=1 Tax=Candidatus Paracaedibacter symbiosus TaxID=244582 RepID=UPI0005096E29|nr:hypothetical protein [Candidatus Paracaedibacter symbiosus]